MASRIDDRSSFVNDLRAHADSAALAALCRRVVDRIHETRSIAPSREFVAAQAEELKITHDVVVDGVRIRSVLERGPESVEEWAIVVAFALCRIAVDLESGDPLRARKFVREADTLEALGVDVYSFVEATMTEPARDAVLDAIVAETQDDSLRGRVGRARAYARVEALRTISSGGADAARARVATILADTPLASVLGPVSASHAVRFEARTRPAPRSGITYVLSLVSGFALLRSIGRGLLSLAGIREFAEVRIDSSSVTVDTRVRFGERVLRERTLRVSRDALVSVARATRYPAIRLLVGALALALGIVVGGILVGDGVRSGETYLLIAGAVLVLAGGLVDLALAVLWPASKGRAVLDLVIAPKTVLSLADVPEESALATIDWVRGAR